MSRNRLLFTALLSFAALAGLVLMAPDAWAQRTGSGGTGQGFTYVIKFFCGQVTDTDAQGIPDLDKYGQFLAPGEYYTVINVHNPNEGIATYGVDWFKKVVLDYYIVKDSTGAVKVNPDGLTKPRFVAQKPNDAVHQIFWINQDGLGNTIGTPQPPRTAIPDFTLSRDEASQANCIELQTVTQGVDSSFNDPENSFLIKGFVIIYSRVQLDVTAIYSACDQGTDNTKKLDCDKGGSKGTTTMKVLRIQPNGITPPAGIGLEESAKFNNTTFPVTTTNTDCPKGGCQYIVKFVCGQIVAPTTTIGAHTVESDLSPGEYYTDINLHNPNPKTIKVRKKFTADDPVPDVHGPLTSPVDVTLVPDDAIQINCRDIRESALNKKYPDTPFLKGFVVIFSRQQLDITAAYTACPEDETTTPPVDLDCNGADDVKTLEVRNILPKDFSPVSPDQDFLPAAGVASVGLSGELTFKLQGGGRWLNVALESTQLQVFSLNGQMLHDSGPVQSRALSWQPLLSERPLANGVYLYVVTLRDALGNTVRQVGKFVYLRAR